MRYVYKTHGTCSSQMIVDIDGDVVTSVEIKGGCNGNAKGIASLVQGMKIDDVIQRCKGIRCGAKLTSCPDQLARALEEARAAQ